VYALCWLACCNLSVDDVLQKWSPPVKVKLSCVVRQQNGLNSLWTPRWQWLPNEGFSTLKERCCNYYLPGIEVNISCFSFLHKNIMEFVRRKICTKQVPHIAEATWALLPYPWCSWSSTVDTGELWPCGCRGCVCGVVSRTFPTEESERNEIQFPQQFILYPKVNQGKPR
jgi:hypothetical protein